MPLLDRLQPGSFKGIPFFVKNSEITFGQKTVTHQFPNTDRTEVEFLGAAEDVFTLNIYIQNSSALYIDERETLKRALLESSPGILVHPYEGQIFCAVVGQVGISESDEEFGKAKFSVTFQKTTLQTFPSSALTNSSLIRSLFNTLKDTLNATISNEYIVDNLYQDVFVESQAKLTTLTGDLKSVQSLVPLNSALSSLFNKAVADFEDDQVINLQSSTDMSSAFDSVFSSMDSMATEPIENVIVYQQFFDYGDDDNDDPPISVETQRIESNKKLFNQYVQTMTLALSYSIISTIDFDDDIQMNSVEASLINQYDKIIDTVDSDVRAELTKLRNQAVIYFDNQDVRRVITVEVATNPLTKIVYLFYENLDDFQRIFELNGKEDPTLYSGQIRLLTNE